jgi:hypothetical protein
MSKSPKKQAKNAPFLPRRFGDFDVASGFKFQFIDVFVRRGGFLTRPKSSVNIGAIRAG